MEVGEITSYEALKKHIKAQLGTGSIAGTPTCYQAALDAKAAIASAADHSEKMKAVARYGAEIKRWHHMLTVHCTHIALQHTPTTMTNVAHWQRALFGRSIANAELLRYGKPGRTAAQKFAPLPTDDPASTEAQQFFQKHKDLLKAKASPEAYAATLK